MRKRLHREGMVGPGRVCMCVCGFMCVGRGGAGAEMGGRGVRARRLGARCEVRWRRFGMDLG